MEQMSHRWSIHQSNMGLLEIFHRFICDLFALPPSSSRNRQKIDLCRFDSVLRYLDAPDPTGERFGIKADGRWTDIGDKEMEKAIRDGHDTNSYSLLLSGFPSKPCMLSPSVHKS